MKTPKEVIKSNKFLGFSFYSRKRFFETRIQFFPESTAIDNPTICSFGEDEVLPSGLFSFFQDRSWTDLCSDIILWSFYNLAVAGKINIVVFKDEQTYLSFLKFDFESIRFELISDEASEDFFENVILEQIKINHAIEKSRTEAAQLINDLFNRCIGRKELNKPAKTFMEVILKQNSDRFDWFDMANKYSILGMIKDFDIEIEDSKKAKLKRDHATIKTQFAQNLKRSKSMHFFQDEMYDLISKDLMKRYPSSDSDSGD